MSTHSAQPRPAKLQSPPCRQWACRPSRERHHHRGMGDNGGMCSLWRTAQAFQVVVLNTYVFLAQLLAIRSQYTFIVLDGALCFHRASGGTPSFWRDTKMPAETPHRPRYRNRMYRCVGNVGFRGYDIECYSYYYRWPGVPQRRGQERRWLLAECGRPNVQPLAGMGQAGPVPLTDIHELLAAKAISHEVMER